MEDSVPGGGTDGDVLNLAGDAVKAADTAGTNGTDSALTVSGVTVKSHSITDGVISFDDLDGYTAALVIDSEADLAAVVDYLSKNDIGTAGATVALKVNMALLGESATNHTFVYTQTTADAGGTGGYDLVALEGVTSATLNLITSGATAGGIIIA